MKAGSTSAYASPTDLPLKLQLIYQHHTGVGTVAKSDAIIIVPQEHSPTTQELEAWFGSLASARRTTQPHSDDIGIVSSGAHSPKVTSPRCKVMSREPTNVPAEMWRQLWTCQQVNNQGSKIKVVNDTDERNAKSGDQFSMKSIIAWQYMFPLGEDKFTSRCSDAIHIVPLSSFPDEQQKISTKEKHVESTTQHGNEQKLEALADGLLIDKLEEQKTPPPVKNMDLSMATTPPVQEIRAENFPITLSSTSVSETHLESEQMAEAIPLEEHTESAPTVQKTPSAPPTELETNSNFVNMLEQFGEPCLAEKPVAEPGFESWVFLSLKKKKSSSAISIAD
ncbi:hypothetical protein EJB05_22807, partial [Eragrostis curvula]